MQLLKNAGIVFEPIPAPVDERMIEAPLVAGGRNPAEIALALAEAKAVAVSQAEPTALVVGADQILEADGKRWNKPISIRQARAQLEQLSGRTHALHSGVAVARGGAVNWHHVETARLTMRALSADFIDAYLRQVGDDALASVGAYQIEGFGIQLFERIEGDFFTILGLPLLPLLGRLRAEKVIAS
jgi:septum formation protein